MNGAELAPGEIGIAVASEGDLVAGAEYEVLQVLEEGRLVQVMAAGGVRRVGRLSQRCYLCQASAQKQILVPIRYLRRRRPPTWEDVRTSCGWAPTREVVPA